VEILKEVKMKHQSKHRWQHVTETFETC